MRRLVIYQCCRPGMMEGGETIEKRLMREGIWPKGRLRSVGQQTETKEPTAANR